MYFNPKGKKCSIKAQIETRGRQLTVNRNKVLSKWL